MSDKNNLRSERPSMHPLFQVHGQAEVELSDAILTVHMRGDWNVEMRSQTAQQMAAHIPALNATGPWAILNVLHDTLVFGEAIYADTRKDYAARPPHSQLRAVAFVLSPQADGARIMAARFERLLEGVITSKVFTNPDQARSWLTAQLAT
jgi:predicted metal-dependent hydrolase